MDNHGEEGGGGGCLGGGRGGFVLGRTGHDCRSRDIRRRLEVIQKKMTDLQELGVPCAFCYASVRNTGSLFAMGDSAITQVIEGCSDEILQQLSKNYSHQSAPISLQRNGEIRVVLPPLSGPIDELGFIELRALVVGIVKDLQLRWTDPRPSFWPSDVPFQNPRTVSGVHQGYWTVALKKVVQSMYAFFHPGSSGSGNCAPISPSTEMPAKVSPHKIIKHNEGLSVVPQLLDEQSSMSPLETQDGINAISSHRCLVQQNTPKEKLTHRNESGTIIVLNEEQQDSDTDTISVCSLSEDERDGGSGTCINGAVSYFGYEIAASECSTSPQLNSGHSSEHEETDEAAHNGTAAVSTVSPVLQPVFCYDPRLYSHLYSSSLQLPFLVPPNVLRNQVYQVPVTAAKTLPVSTKPSVISEGKNSAERAQEASSTPLNFSFKLPKTSVIQNSTAEYRSTSKHQPSQEEIVGRIRRSRIETDHRGKRSRNGIFIYTTPTTPPKFMSLNSKKEQVEPKLVANEVVRSVSNGELKDQAKIRRHIVGPSEPVNGEQGSSVHSGEEAEGGNGRGGKRFPVRRKRDLVFHWYQTPTAPQHPNKRTKLVNSAELP